MVSVSSPVNLIWCPGNWRTDARHETPGGPKSWNSWFSKRSGSQITVQKLQSAAPARNVKILIMTRRAFCSVRVIRLQRAASSYVEINWPFYDRGWLFANISRFPNSFSTRPIFPKAKAKGSRLVASLPWPHDPPAVSRFTVSRTFVKPWIHTKSLKSYCKINIFMFFKNIS